MKTKITTFIAAIVLLLFDVSTVVAQGTKAYFKKNGTTVFESVISDIDSIVFKQNDINEYNVFPNAEIVEEEYMGETVYCHYVDGYYIMEGDIIIKSNFDYDDENDSILVALRAAELKGNKRWTNGKVYYIMSNNSAVKNSIEAAISHYHSNTNLKFIRLYTTEASRYITQSIRSGKIVFKDGNANLSNLGMQDIAQELSLDVSSPSAIHEIGHAVGLVHEHSRSDRDSFIIVNYNNIKTADRHNFDKSNIATHSVSFDYGSIMMYPPRIQNAIDPNIAVITKKDGSAFTEYQRNGLSPLDKAVINNMYSMVNAEPDIMIYEQNIQPTAYSCELKGELIYEGKPSVTTQYGIRIIKINDGLIFHDKLGTRINNPCVFSCKFTDLEPNTKYRAKAYAIQNGDYVWSENEIYFTTQEKYQRFDIGMTWSQAKAYCENLGGHLVTITSQEEQNIVQSLIASGTKNQYWLGGYVSGIGGVWIIGENFVYSNWGPNQPDDYKGVEQYIQMYRVTNPYKPDDHFGHWNDITGDNVIEEERDFFSTEFVGFVCEFE